MNVKNGVVMTDNKLVTVYLLFRPRNMGYIYMYGAKVHFEDEDLIYENAIVSPGKALILWKEMKIVDGGFIPDIIMPRLTKDVDYQFQIISQEQPEHSLSLAMTTFDKDDQQLNYQIFSGKAGTFSLTAKEASYWLELASLGNQKLRFKMVLLAAAPLLSEYAITTKMVGGIRTVLIEPQEPQERSRLHIHVRNYTATIQALNFEPKQEHLFILMPVQSSGIGDFTTSQIEELVKYLNKFRQSNYVLQIDNNHATGELVKILRAYISNNN
ncbi:hypothetical protein OZX56_07615 [Lactobacillus sp. ESL0684]|uniref:accessory Sec system protein Asp3 n=1 Tax=Lactobacillus sp. ESL0684 TaxID=2983213 RepID=UPI0023F72CB5|nr:accessory Sec system protein Asp3 [Lactobacillus sp. ESL0684]WEV43361.1 hypothetical protein OZX56_07615 [Lactobacillus sp. ESL0684]